MPIDIYAAAIAIERFSGTERLLFLLGSAFCFWMAVRGVKKGEVELGLATFSKRSHGPILVWFGILVNVLIGAVGLLSSIFGRTIWK